MIQYEDFSLKIEPRRGDTYPVIVLRSPAGEGRSEFELPFQPDQIGDILFHLGQTVRSSSRAPRRDISPEEIYVMNADGSEQTNLTNHPATDWFPSWSPNGKYLAFMSERDGNGEIYIMGADGSNPIRLTNDAAEDSWPAWGP